MPFERAEFCKLCKTKHDPRESLRAHARLWTPEMGRFGVPEVKPSEPEPEQVAVVVDEPEQEVEQVEQKANIGVRVCSGCGRPVEGRKRFCDDACRMRYRRGKA